MAHYWISDSGSINVTVVKKMSLVLGSRFNFHYLLPYTSPEQWYLWKQAGGIPSWDFQPFFSPSANITHWLCFMALKKLSTVSPMNIQYCWIWAGQEECKPGIQVKGSIECKSLLSGERVCHQPLGSMQRVGQLSYNKEGCLFRSSGLCNVLCWSMMSSIMAQRSRKTFGTEGFSKKGFLIEQSTRPARIENLICLDHSILYYKLLIYIINYWHPSPSLSCGHLHTMVLGVELSYTESKPTTKLHLHWGSVTNRNGPLAWASQLKEVQFLSHLYMQMISQ